MGDFRVKVVSWNMHMGIGRDGLYDKERAVRVVRQFDADIVGLQEVDSRPNPEDDDLAALGRHTGLTTVSGPTMKRAGIDYGNALLTRLPVTGIERYDLTVKKREPRGLLVTQLDWNGQPLIVAVTHLGLRVRERLHQVERLCRALAKHDRLPLVLLGDFNEWIPRGRSLRNLSRHFIPANARPTYPATFPLLPLDRFWTRGAVRLHSVHTVKNGLTQRASDHLPLCGMLAATDSPLPAR